MSSTFVATSPDGRTTASAKKRESAGAYEARSDDPVLSSLLLLPHAARAKDAARTAIRDRTMKGLSFLCIGRHPSLPPLANTLSRRDPGTAGDEPDAGERITRQ